MLAIDPRWPLVAFLGYGAVSMLMVNDPARPLLPPPLGGKVQLGDAVFPLAIGLWLLVGAPGFDRAARAAGWSAAIWAGVNAATASVAVWPGPAWRETAAFVYLGAVLVWGVAVLSEPDRLRTFVRWMAALVGIVVLVGLTGWLLALLAGRPNWLVEWRYGMPLFGERIRIRSTLAPTSRLLITLLLVALPAVFALRRHGTARARRWCGWLLVAMTVCAVLTYARPLLEYVALLGVLTLRGWRWRWRAVLPTVGVPYVVGLVALAAVSTWHVTDHEVRWDADPARSLVDPVGTYYATLPDVGVQTVGLRIEWVHDSYFILKRVAWRGFLERPVMGWGPDTWRAVQAWAKDAGYAPRRFAFDSAHGEAFTVAAEMGLAGLAGLMAFWWLCLRGMRAPAGGGFAADLARSQALGCGAALLASLHLDIMRFRFLWLFLALGIAAALCAREEAPA